MEKLCDEKIVSIVKRIHTKAYFIGNGVRSAEELEPYSSIEPYELLGARRSVVSLESKMTSSGVVFCVINTPLLKELNEGLVQQADTGILVILIHSAIRRNNAYDMLFTAKGKEVLDKLVQKQEVKLDVIKGEV